MLIPPAGGSAVISAAVPTSPPGSDYIFDAPVGASFGV